MLSKLITVHAIIVLIHCVFSFLLFCFPFYFFTQQWIPSSSSYNLAPQKIDLGLSRNESFLQIKKTLPTNCKLSLVHIFIQWHWFRGGNILPSSISKWVSCVHDHIPWMSNRDEEGEKGDRLKRNEKGTNKSGSMYIYS